MSASTDCTCTQPGETTRLTVTGIGFPCSGLNIDVDTSALGGTGGVSEQRVRELIREALDGLEGGVSEKPNLRVGVETRLNRLREGKPVYATLMDYGWIKRGEVRIPHGIEDVEWITVDPANSSIHWPNESFFSLPTYPNYASNGHSYVFSSGLTTVDCGSGVDRTNQIYAVIALNYTKTTDSRLDE